MFGARRLGLAVGAVVMVVAGVSPPAHGAARGIAGACPTGWVVGDRFADVPDSGTHATAIDCIASWKVTEGTTPRTYTPGTGVTRGQMATFVGRMVERVGGTLPADPPSPFPDTDGHHHAHRIDALAAVGIVSGTTDGRFHPDRHVTRAQMATFLTNAYEHATGSALPAGPDAFNDDDGDTHEAAIDRLAAAGITAGVTPTTYRPGAPVARDAMASFLARTIDHAVASGHTAAPGPVGLAEIGRFDAPIGVATRAGHPGVLYVAERPGRVVAVAEGGVSTVLDITSDVAQTIEGGLLSLAFSPDGGHLYVSFTDVAGNSAVDEIATGNGAASLDLGSRRRVLSLEQPAGNHNGGHLTFGPDGHLYVAFGDGGARAANAQETSNLYGSILRIDPRAQADGSAYAVPPDNPFVGGGGRPEIWAYGLRNPWRFSFDARNGDLWIADVGERRVEEVDLLPADAGGGRGANLGWPALEGSLPFSGPAPADHVLPAFEYDRTGDRCSITGGLVYRGNAIGHLWGTYLWGDFCESVLHGLDVAGTAVAGTRSLGAATSRLVAFGEDSAGEIVVVSLDGGVYRVVPG